MARTRSGNTVGRRTFLAAGAATTAAYFAAHATGDYSLVRAAPSAPLPPPAGGFRQQPGSFDDTPIDPVAVANGTAGWYPTRYGADDQIGALNEITPEKTLAALQMIKPGRNRLPKTYNLGEILQEGVPAFGTRTYVQTRQGPTEVEPYAGDNQINGMEERYSTTYHIATQLDGLPHIGVRDTFYNGTKVPDMIGGSTAGVVRLGQELVNPFITRGILLDVLSVKVAQGAEDALGEPVAGNPILGDSYRITVEDLQEAMDFGGIRSIEPGDVVVIRTGWSQLFSLDPDLKARYLATEPGIYLREARWLAQFRPAVVGGDPWALEVLPAPPPWTDLQLFPVHQELLAHHGIRIGEGFNVEGLAADEVYEFLFFYTTMRAKGATAGNVAPGAIGQPRSRGR